MTRDPSRQEDVEERVDYDPAGLSAHRRRRRQRIVHAAIELIEEREYGTVQMRDVAQRSDVALGTVYRYFSSKEHLYAAALAEWGAGVIPHLGPGGVQADTDAERLRSVLRRVIESHQKWPQMMRAEMILERSDDPNSKVLLQQFSQRYDSVILASVRDMSPTQAEAVAYVVQSVMYRALRSWAVGRCTIADVERHADRTIDLIFSPLS
ncbi:TetR family transcriptional regulator [Mycobacterium sp. DL440]|uniref:TetR family transcriptional regulator n=1 Tax=Mycobacterium sp. DL440 TaxID=2675523 RepID=UPI00141F22DC|nr:TetR family transcriptional regulator [Mycobacterium sp. DL440]